jgi:hypothetical protein
MLIFAVGENGHGGENQGRRTLKTKEKPGQKADVTE